MVGEALQGYWNDAQVSSDDVKLVSTRLLYRYRLWQAAGGISAMEDLFATIMPAVILCAGIMLVIMVVRTVSRNSKKRKSFAQAANQDEPKAENRRDISEHLNYLEQHLGMPLPEFRVQNFEYFFERLTYEAHDPGAVTSVTDQVLRHYRLDPSKVRIEAEFLDQKPEDSEEVRGQFQNAVTGYGKVRIILKPEDSEFDTVVAIIMHECAHYFSEIHHTKLEDKNENERLTDATAIWLGAGQRMERGCFPRSNVQIGYLTQDECHYAICETERRRQAAIAESESFRKLFETEAAAQSAAIDMAGRMLKMEVLCGNENQEKLHTLKAACRHKQDKLARLLTQLKHAMSKQADCEMNARLLQNALAARKALEPALRPFEAFRPLTMDGLLLDQEAYAYYAAACEHAQSGNVFAQFEMLRFYHAHPSAIASEEAQFLLAKLEKSDAADAQYLLGRCWNEGICVPTDHNAAVRCWVQAAGLGSEQAEQALRELYKNQMKMQNEA